MNLLGSLTVANRLRLGFGLVLALLVVVAVVGIVRLQVLASSLQDVAARDMQLLQRVALLQSAVLQGGSAIRDAATQEDLKVFKESVATIRTSKQQEVALLKEITQLAGGQYGEILSQIGGGIETLHREIQATLDLVDAAEYDLAKQQVIKAIRPAQTAAGAALTALFDNVTKRANDGAVQANAAGELTRTLVIALTLAAVGIGLGIAWIVTESITRPLHSAVEFARHVSEGDLSHALVDPSRDELGKLLASLEFMRGSLAELIRRIRQEGNQVSSLSTDLAKRTRLALSQAEAQSDRFLSISASLDEMSSSIRQVSESADGVKNASMAAQGLTRESNSIMQANLAHVDEVLNGVSASGQIVQELSLAVAKISDMAQVIKDIADQTNLLALNAAIEAARAGEQGRGFAVVADEVRKLAERTAASTADISSKVQEISGRSNDAVRAMDQVRGDVTEQSGHSRQVGAKLDNLLSSASQVAELAGHIANATHEQSSTSQTMTSSMYEISQIADQTLEAIRTAGASAERMDQTARELNQLVERFRLD